MSNSEPTTAVRDDDSKPTRVRWLVCLWMSAAAVIAYLSRTSISVADTTIRDSLRISEDEMGLVMGPAFFWTYALAQIPTAWLGQRFGSRMMLVIFTAAGSASVLLFGLANSLTVLILARMAMGISQAGTFPCATQTFARWNSGTERAVANGFLSGAMQVGSGIGLILTGFLIGIVGWRATFLLFALPGVAWAIGFGRWFRNDPSEHPGVNQAELVAIASGKPNASSAPDSSTPHATPWRRLLGSGTMWLICIQQFFRAGAHVFFASWFATYLQKTRGVSIEQSAWLNAMPVIAVMLASFVGGGLSDAILVRTGQLGLARKGVATTSLLLCAAIVAAAWFIDDPLFAVLLISAGVFMAGFAGPISYAVTIDVGGRNAPAVFATMNMVGNLGAGLLPLVVPHFRSAIEELATGTGDAYRTSWNAVLLLFATTYLIAALCWVWLRIEPDLLDRDSAQP